MRAIPARWPAAVAVAGVVAAAAVAAAGPLPLADAALLAGYAVGGAAAVGLAAAALLHRVRGAVAQAAVAGLVPVLATAVGTLLAAWAMFISAHDLQALLVVLVSAGAAGLVVALTLGSGVAKAGRSLGVVARRLGQDAGEPGGDAHLGGRPAGARRPPVPELRSIAEELERTSAGLVEARERAAAHERSRRDLVAWVSHDLRTPLAGIRAMVEALEDGVVADPATVDRYHRTIRQEADRLAGLVDALFELSRIQAGALNLDLEQVPLDELVAEAVAGASIAAGAKHLDLRGEVHEPPPVVALSAPEMARVVRNLLDNAIRHTPEGGVVRVEAGLDGDGSAVLSVVDACGGIPEPDLGHVFEMAYRGDAARTPGQGAGLGLAVAQGLVEAHGGRIDVRNEGDGCRFTVRLPRDMGV